jgi:hypothetical protein
LAAGAPQLVPSRTVVYAEAGNAAEAAPRTAVIMKSPTPPSTTWTLLAAPHSSTQKGTLKNPTTAPFIAFCVPADCGDLNLAHGQAWYNLSIAVDPTNSNNAIFGGNLCGARTTDGATFQLISHWLPSSGQGTTAFGTLPYVHADWHTSIVVNIGGVLLVLVGSDGGLFVSDDVFRATAGELSTWTFPDIGLVTHLFYNIGSGDPVFGNPDVVFGGLQDNGSRWRLINDESLIQAVTVKNWDQVQGGDGIGATVAMDPQGQNATYWISSEFNRNFCKPRNHDCEKSTTVVNGVEVANWTNAANPFLAKTDGEPFLMRYAPVGDAAASVVSASVFNGWKIAVDFADQLSYTLMTPAGFTNGGAARQVRGNGISAAPFTYTIGGQAGFIYGVPLTGGNSSLITDVNGTFTVIPAATPINVGGVVVTSTSSVATPSDPTHLGGTDPTKTWLISSVTPSPAPSHLFVTTNGGTSWATFGATGANALPNIPVYVVKFDPSDPTDKTIYAATELGLYRTNDGGANWSRFGSGLPLVRVTDITISSNGSVVRVSTYGRGVWEIHPHGAPSTAAALGDWDNNKVIDFFDMAPLAGRLGTAANAGAPLSPSIDYDNTLDITNDSKLDESDLAAQLAKFGSTP